MNDQELKAMMTEAMLDYARTITPQPQLSQQQPAPSTELVLGDLVELFKRLLAELEELNNKLDNIDCTLDTRLSDIECSIRNKRLGQ